MANIDNVQLPDGSSYNIVDNTSGFASQSYVDSAVSSITKTTIGLGNVDNTSDLNKPISTATQTALDTLDEDKADKTDIATVESGTTASRAYSVGELVYVSGTLYRVKTAIAIGATFTPGTNVEVANISNIIKEINKGSVSVTSDGTKTFATLLNELYALIDTSKMSIHSKLSVDGYIFTRYTTTLTFTGTSTSSTTLDTRTITIGSNDSVYYEGVISASGFTSYDISTITAPVGTVITLYY